MNDIYIEAYIGVGSNIKPEANILGAGRMLKENVDLLATSRFYRTKPLRDREQSDYMNGVWKIGTQLSPRKLKKDVLERIEASLHRARTSDPYASRTIDLDLLLYGDLVCSDEDLIIPDPDIRARAFIAVPLLEIDLQLLMPDTGERLATMPDFPDRNTMSEATEFTHRLQEALSI